MITKDDIAYLKTRVARQVQNKSDVDDLVQDILLIAYNNADKYASRAKYQHWLYGIMNNVLLHYARHKARMNNYFTEQDDEDYHITLVDISTPEAIMEGQQLVHTIEAAFDKLPPSIKKAAILREQGNLSYKDISKSMGITEASVNTYLETYRKALCQAAAM